VGNEPVQVEVKPGSRIRVLCVDDNDLVSDALRRKFATEADFMWCGSLPDASDLADFVAERRPDVVLLDIDMPGIDTFDALRGVTARCPDSRVVMLSGHVRKDLIDRAVEAGAWGYLSKGEETADILEAIRGVAAGRFMLSREAAAEYKRR